MCGDVPTIPKEIRREIRAEVHQLKLVMQQPESNWTPDLITHARHVYGRVAWLNQFHPEQAAKLKSELSLHSEQMGDLSPIA